MRTPDPDTARRLIDWRPPLGVISVFVDLRPADRGEPWRIELRDGLDAVVQASDHAPALRETAARIRDHFPAAGAKRPVGRFHIGFVEVALSPSREEWFEVQAPAVRTEVCHDPSPHISPLMKLIDQAPLTGVAAISADRVEFSEWSFGVVETVGARDFSRPDDPHERKGPTVDPSRGTQVSSSGRDQFDQRIGESRARFLAAAGADACQIAAERGWNSVACYGEEDLFRRFAAHTQSGDLLRLGGHMDLLAKPVHEIARVVSQTLGEFESDRERELVRRVKDAALSHAGRGALGVQATVDCLAEGRVEHLLYDPSRQFSDALPIGHQTFLTDGAIRRNGGAVTERIIQRAIETGASVTPLGADPAAALAEFDGMAALLRY